jgi:hypothetical protein
LLKEVLEREHTRKELRRLHVTDEMMADATKHEAKWWQWSTLKLLLGATVVFASTAATVGAQMDGDSSATEDADEQGEDELNADNDVDDEEPADEEEQDGEDEDLDHTTTASLEDPMADTDTDDDLDDDDMAPDSWIEHFDEKEQNPYWQHKVTNKITWNDPYCTSDGDELSRVTTVSGNGEDVVADSVPMDQHETHTNPLHDDDDV